MNTANIGSLEGCILADRYQIEQCLRSDAFKCTYSCKQLNEDHRHLILKRIHYSQSASFNPGEWSREFSLLHRLRHPNFVPLLDFGIMENPTSLYFIEEWIEGKDLVSGTEGMETCEIVRILARIFWTVRYLHRRRIIHGRLSPSNIFIRGSEKEPLQFSMNDFGLSGLYPSFDFRAGDFDGMLPYSAPELLLGGMPDFSSDLYALGVLTYLVLTRKLPFEDADPGFLMQKHLQGSPNLRPVARLKGGKYLTRLLRGLLAKDAADRLDTIDAATDIFNSAIKDKSFWAPLREEPESSFTASRLIGREMEMERLRECAERVRDSGRGWTVFVSGEAGSGKTRCMEELKYWGQLEGWQIIEGPCSTLEEGSYSPYKHILEGLHSNRQEEIFHYGQARSKEGSGIFDSSLDYAAGQFRDLLTRELVRHMSERPTLLLLDDFHEADEATSMVLDYLSSDIQAHPILMCVGFRSGEEIDGALSRVIALALRQNRGEALVLETLPGDSVEDLIGCVTGEPQLKDTLGSWIFRHVGGNPFFIEEMLKHLVEQQVLQYVEGEWIFNPEVSKQLEVPDSVGMVIKRRIGQLSSESREAANWLALINRPVTPKFLCSVASLRFSKISTSLEDLLHRQMIRRKTKEKEDEIEFRHDLIAEVFRSCLSPRIRQRMHARIAEALEKETESKVHLQELARHSMEGKLGAKAVWYALSLASQARMEFSHEIAVRCFEYVLDERIGMSGDDLCRVSIDAADTMLALGLPKRAMRRLKDEMEVTRRIGRDLKGRMYMQMALSCQHQGDFVGQEFYCRKGLQLFRGVPLSEKNLTRAMLYAELALRSAVQSHPRRGLQYLKKAMDSCPDTGSEVLSGRIQSIAAFLHSIAGDLRQALLAIQIAETILSSTDEYYLACSAYSTHGLILMRQGRFAKALEKHKQAVQMSDKSRSVIPRAQALGNLAECLCRMGRMQEARKALDKAMLAAGESENPAIDHALNAIMAEVLFAENEYGGAYCILRRIVEETGNGRALYAVGHAYYIAAGLNFSLGNFDSAIDSIGMLRKIESPEAPCYEHEMAEALYARILFERGRGAESLEALNALDRAVTKKRWPYHQAIIKLHLVEVLSRQGEFEAASRHARIALRLARGMQSEYLIGYGLLLAGVVCLRRCLGGTSVRHSDDQTHSFLTDHPGMLEAVEHLNAACNVAETTRSGELAWRAHAELCIAYGSLQKQDDRYRHARSAYHWLCKLENRVPGEMLPSFRNAFGRNRVKTDLVRLIESKRYAAPGKNSLVSGDTGADQSRILFRVSATVNSIRDLDPLLGAILDQLIQAMDMERALIYLKEVSQENLKLAKGRSYAGENIIITVNQNILDEVGLRGNPIVSSNVAKDSRLSGKVLTVPGEPGRLLCAPLKISGRTIGILYTDHPMPLEELNESAISLFAAFCNLSAIAIDNAIVQSKLMQEKVELERYLHRVREEYAEIIGASSAMESLRDRIAIVAASPLDVLIMGESGTGKELVAKAIHRTCRRNSGVFIPVDCGSLSDSLAEAELFGYRKGAFTGANENRQGLLEAANGGILFLDEISNLPYRLQAKFLRVLEEREVRRVGEIAVRKIDVQILAATNRDLTGDIEHGRFREDLFYRLKKMTIQVPSLRERIEDIPLLVRHFLETIAKNEDGKLKHFSPRAMDLLNRYSYPGNIRELRNIVSGAYYSTAGPMMDFESLPPEVHRDYLDMAGPESDLAARLYRDILEGKGNFQDLIKNPFLNHQFGASVIRGVVRRALVDDRGRYRDAFTRLKIPNRAYAVTMQFLKRHHCYLDFRPFRKERSDTEDC